MACYLFRRQFPTKTFFFVLQRFELVYVKQLQCSYSQTAKPKEKKTETWILQHIDKQFEEVSHDKRNKEEFLTAIKIFKQRSKNERGYVEFIYSALKHMKDYGLDKDLEVYKAILKVFPVGPLLPTNVWQKVFFHHPHQQICCIKVLDHMEWNLVYPDIEIFEIVKAVFGPWSNAAKKTRRMLYWYPRLRYTNKYLDRQLQEDRYVHLDFVKLAKLGLEMMCRDKGSQISYHTVTDNQSFIVSAQSTLQRRLIARNDPSSTCYYVNGPFLVYVSVNPLRYMTFTADPSVDSERLMDRFVNPEEIEDLYKEKLYKGPLEEQPTNGTIHEQIDQTILAMGVFENINNNSASAWINYLQRQNPSLKQSTVIIRLNNNNN